MKKIRLKIADFVFSIYNNQSATFDTVDKPYEKFICFDDPEIILTGHYDSKKEVYLTSNNKIFDSGTFWKVYRIDRKSVFVLNTFLPEQRPFCIAVFRSDYRRGDIYYYTPSLSNRTDSVMLYPLSFPLFHLLMISLLSQGHGVLVHACGINEGGKGYLFPASSNHGKTTISRLWEDEAIILNDERIIIRRHKGRFWIYGTPWHGEYERVSSYGVPLEKIFFLERADKNRIFQKIGIASTSMLLTHCFLPFWEPHGMQFTLDFCAGLVETVPCYELGFVPDKSIIDFVRCMK